MSLIALSTRHANRLSISVASDAAGLVWKPTQTDADLLLAALPTEKPRFTAVTSEFLLQPELFVAIQQTLPQTHLVLCLLPDAVADFSSLWPHIDTLPIDVFCRLDELTDCLITLNSGRFFRSSLLARHPTFMPKELLPGLNKLSKAERNVLNLLVAGKDGRTIADELCISYNTRNNHRANIAQTLGITGGPGSLTRFVLLNAEKIRLGLAR